MAQPIIRYSSDTALNLQLRSALAQVVNVRCYSCGEPKDFSDLQIDHLIPRGTTSSELEELRPGLGLPNDFDVNGPENLAVICARCDQKKSNKDLRNSLVLQLQIKESITKADKVRATVVSMRAGHKLSAALSSAAAADLDNATARETFRTLVPGLVQRLALLDQGRIDYVTAVVLQADEVETQYDVRVLFNNNLRFMEKLTSLMLEADVVEIARASAADLVNQVVERVRSALVAGPDRDVVREFSVDEPTIYYFDVQVDDGETLRDGDTLLLKLMGVMEGRLSAHVLGEDHSEPGFLRDSQTDVSIYGRFESRTSLDFDSDFETEGFVFDHDVSQVDVDPDWETDALDRIFEKF